MQSLISASVLSARGTGVVVAGASFTAAMTCVALLGLRSTGPVFRDRARATLFLFIEVAGLALPWLVVVTGSLVAAASVLPAFGVLVWWSTSPRRGWGWIQRLPGSKMCARCGMGRNLRTGPDNCGYCGEATARFAAP